MAERTHIPNSPACGEWETLLADALDGLLLPEEEAKFKEHKAVCPACSALYEEARKGREWLEFLSPEPEPPDGLFEKILATTGPGHKHPVGLPVPATAGGVPAFMPPVWQKPGFMARVRYTMQPRLMMTAAMAFFSIALTLSMSGVRLTSLRLADFRPRAVRSYMERQLTMASVPIVRYYDHLRLVYEVESRVRELRGESQGTGNGESQPKEPATPGETRQNPGQKPSRNDGGLRVDPQEQPENPALGPSSGATDELLEASLSIDSRSAFTPRMKECSRGFRSVQSGGSEAWERSRVWIA